MCISLSIYIYTHIHIYISLSISLSLYIYIYICIRTDEQLPLRVPTVSSHTFSLLNFKSRASNLRAMACFRLTMLFEFSNLPGAGLNFPD